MYYNKQGKSLNFSQIANAAMASDMSVENYIDMAGITEMSDDVVAVDKDGFNFESKGDFDFTGTRKFTKEERKADELARTQDPKYMVEAIMFNTELDLKLKNLDFKRKALGGNESFQMATFATDGGENSILKATKPLFESREYEKLTKSDFQNIVLDKYYAEVEYELGMKKRKLAEKADDTAIDSYIEADGTFSNKIDMQISRKMKEYRTSKAAGADFNFERIESEIQELKNQKEVENRSYILDLKTGTVVPSRVPLGNEQEGKFKFSLAVNTKLAELSADPEASVEENILQGYKTSVLALQQLNKELDKTYKFRVEYPGERFKFVDATLRSMLNYKVNNPSYKNVEFVKPEGGLDKTKSIQSYTEDLKQYATDVEVYRRMYHLNEGAEGLSRKGWSDFGKYFTESFVGTYGYKGAIKPKRIDVIRSYGRTLGEVGAPFTASESEFLDGKLTDSLAEFGGSARFLVEIWGAGKFLKLGKYAVKAVPMARQWIRGLKMSKSYYDNAAAVALTRTTLKEGAKFYIAEQRAFGDADFKTAIKGAAFGAGGFGGGKLLGSLISGSPARANLYNYLLTSPISFNIASEFSELVGAAVSEIKGTSTVENYIDKAYGNFSETTRRVISNGIFSYTLGFGRQAKAMYDYKQKFDLAAARKEVFTSLTETAKKAGVTTEEFNNSNFHTELYSKIQSKLKGKELKKFENEYEAFLDIVTRENAFNDLRLFENKETAKPVIERENKAVIEDYKKEGKDVEIKVITEAEAKERKDYDGRDNAYFDKVGNKVTLSYILDKYSFNIGVHEQSHAHADLFLGTNIKFNALFFNKLKSVMSRIQTEFVDKEGNPQNLKQAFEAKFGEAPEVKQHAEAFAYVGEFLSNPQNYTRVKQANGFYSLQGVLSTLMKDINPNRKYNFAKEKDIVRWFGDYIQTVKRGGSTTKLFAELENIVEPPAEKIVNETAAETNYQTFKSERIDTKKLSEEIQEIYKQKGENTTKEDLISSSKNYPIAGDKLGPFIDAAISKYNISVPEQFRISLADRSPGGARYDLVTEILYDLSGKNRGLDNILKAYNPEQGKLSTYLTGVIRLRAQEYKERSVDAKAEGAELGFRLDTETAEKVLEKTEAPTITSTPFDSKPTEGIQNRSETFSINGEKRTLNQETVVEVENAYKELFISDNNPTLFSNVSRKLRTSTSKFINDQLGISETMDNKTAATVAERNFRQQARQLYKGMPEFSSLEFYDNSQIGKSYLKSLFENLGTKFKTDQLTVEEAARTNARAYMYKKKAFNEAEFVNLVLRGRSPKEKLNRIKTLYQFFHDVTGGQIARDVLNPATTAGKQFYSEIHVKNENGKFINPTLVKKYEVATTELALQRFRGPTPVGLKSEQLTRDLKNLNVNAQDYRKQFVNVLSTALGVNEAERLIKEEMPSLQGEVAGIFKKHREALAQLDKVGEATPIRQFSSFGEVNKIIAEKYKDLLGVDLTKSATDKRNNQNYVETYIKEFINGFGNKLSKDVLQISSTNTSGLFINSATFFGKEKINLDGTVKRVVQDMRTIMIKDLKGTNEKLDFLNETFVVDNGTFKRDVLKLLKGKYRNLENNPSKIPQYLAEVRKMLTKPGINPKTKKPYTYEQTLEANTKLREYFYTKLFDYYASAKNKAQALDHISFFLQNQTSIGHGVSRALATFESATIKLGKGVKNIRTGKIEHLYGEHPLQIANFNGNFILNMIENVGNKKAFLDKFRTVSNEFKQGLITKELQLFVDSPKNGGRLGIIGQMKEDITIGSESNFIRDQAILSTQYDLKTGKSFADKMNDVILASNVIKKLNKQFKTGFEAENMTTQELVNMSFTVDAAIANGRKYNKQTRSSSTFDFDETLIIGGKNFVTATKDGETIKISSAEWPTKGTELAAQGWKMDFKDFVNVRGGVEGPLMQKLRNQLKKYGPDNIFVLTARQQQAAPAIHGWLKSKGVNIPIENITGLGNSTGEAKALWMLDKFAQGYNDMYFVDDAMSNVKAVRNVLEQLDIKYNVQQARVLKSEQLTKDMDVILTETTGLFGKISPAKAKLLGQSVYTKSYIVPSAQDFVGLLQNFQGFGKVGERHKAFFDDNLHKPYSRAYNELNAAQQAITSDYKALGTLLPTVKKKLNKKIPGEPFTYDQAIRVHRWTEAGFEVPGLSEADVKLLTDVVKNDRNLLSFSQNLAKITKQKAGYIEPTEAWTSQSIVSDLNSLVQKVNRDAYFAEFRQNRELVFGKWENGKLVGENMNKIEATQGPAFKEALEDILWRMETGTNRPAGQNKAVNMHMNFINGSVGATMFLNTRSATLQTLSTLNYINWSDNNPLAAAKAFGNQKQYWSDFLFIFNSDLLKQRRAGLKYNVQEAELAQLASGGDGTGVARKIFANLIKVGFTPTQIADSFAISAGGATFYRNRIKTYIKQGLSGKEAKQKAFLDFQEKTEVAQQSSRPDLISPIQAGPMGRMIFAWGNTPMQYARIQEKAIRDLINNRGDKKEHLSKLLYYGFIQSVAFTAAQNAMFAFSLDEDASFDKDEKSRRLSRMVNNMADSQLRGIGIPGAIASTVKNTVMEYREQSERGFRADHTQTMNQLLSYSPVLGSKFRKIFGYTGVAGGQLKGKTNYEASMLMGFNLNNPRTLAYANLVEATTNVPVGRTVNKLRNLQIAADANYQWWQRAAAFGGWGSWELGIENEGFEDAVRKIKAVRKSQQSFGKGSSKKSGKSFKK